MPKQWLPTQSQYSEYVNILKKYNKLRKQIIKAHRNLESYTPTGRMPSLVVPERHRRMSVAQIRMTGRRLFNLKLRALKRTVKEGLDGFYKQYKNSYLELYKSLIGLDPDYTPFGEGKNFKYSQDLIDRVSYSDENLSKLMEVYNRIVNLSPVVFALLVKTGKMPVFQKLYDEVGRGFIFPQRVTSEAEEAIKTWGYKLNTKQGEEMSKRILSGDKSRIEKYMEYTKKDASKIRSTIDKKYRKK